MIPSGSAAVTANFSFSSEDRALILYRLFLILIIYPLLPLLLLFVMASGWQRQWVFQRLGWLPKLPAKTSRKRIWFHASSVGEVAAARMLIEELRQRKLDVDCVLTTMTIHGCQSAKQSLPADIFCLLAPLDLPGIVEWVIGQIQPDIYVVLETELWPLILQTMKGRGIPVLLANGRLSARSQGKYYRRKWFFQQILASFDRILAISETDKNRFLSLGVESALITVAGNCKYDKKITHADRQRCADLSRMMNPEGLEVLVCGSTHEGEEELIVPVIARLQQDTPTLCVIAPRHLDRLGKLREMLVKNETSYDLFSEIQMGASRRSQLILLDTYGELAIFYGLATYIFCGGSLVEQSGHNVMEAALWGRPVFFGASMADFQDAADTLLAAGGGFQLRESSELESLISVLRTSPVRYQQACQAAEQAALAQQGSAARQVDAVSVRLAQN